MSLRQGFMVETDHDLPDACAAAADAGFDFVELNGEGASRSRHAEPAAIGATVADAGLDLAVHLPYALDPGSPHEHVREGACRELEAAVDAAAAMGADRAVFHATTYAKPHRWDREHVWSALVESADRLANHGADRGVTVAAENLKGPFVDAGDLPDLLAATDVAVCLDTGHAHATGHDTAWQAAFLREHGDRVAHVHLNDTRRDDTDEHLPVGVGALDFAPIADAMVETGWSGTATHEVFIPDGSFENPAGGKARFDALLAT